VSIDLSIVVVSWNVRDLLAACLRSIQAGPVDLVPPGGSSIGDRLHVEVIVVDSGSQDGTAAMLDEQFPWAQIIDTGENVGFTKGNNIGIAAAQGRYVFLLNPDTEIVTDALPRMVVYLDRHPRVGVVGPQLLESDRTTVQSSRRRFPTLVTALFESTWLQPFAPRGVLKRYYVLDEPDDRTFRVDWVTGAALMTRRAVLDQVGGLDENYFMYSEELDWCRRAKEADWHVVYLPSAQVVHHGGKSSEQAAAQRHIYFQTSKVRYFEKHHDPASALVLRIFLLASYSYQLVLESFKGLLGHKRDMRRERVRAYWQVLRTGLRS
jgi:GT2 family glycosyltransferase